MEWNWNSKASSSSQHFLESEANEWLSNTQTVGLLFRCFPAVSRWSGFQVSRRELPGALHQQLPHVLRGRICAMACHGQLSCETFPKKETKHYRPQKSHLVPIHQELRETSSVKLSCCSNSSWGEFAVDFWSLGEHKIHGLLHTTAERLCARL